MTRPRCLATSGRGDPPFSDPGHVASRQAHDSHGEVSCCGGSDECASHGVKGNWFHFARVFRHRGGRRPQDRTSGNVGRTPCQRTRRVRRRLSIVCQFRSVFPFVCFRPCVRGGRRREARLYREEDGNDSQCSRSSGGCRGVVREGVGRCYGNDDPQWYPDTYCSRGGEASGRGQGQGRRARATPIRVLGCDPVGLQQKGRPSRCREEAYLRRRAGRGNRSQWGRRALGRCLPDLAVIAFSVPSNGRRLRSSAGPGPGRMSHRVVGPHGNEYSRFRLTGIAWRGDVNCVCRLLRRGTRRCQGISGPCLFVYVVRYSAVG